MGRNKIKKLLKEYRKQPKWYYHVTFDAIETGQLFNNDEEYACGMNSVAIGQYVFGLSVIAFVLMVNHCHFLVYGSGESIVRFSCLSRDALTGNSRRTVFLRFRRITDSRW